MYIVEHYQIVQVFETTNRIGGVIVSVLALSAVDHGFEPRLGQTKTINLVFVVSSLSIKEKEQRMVGSESE